MNRMKRWLSALLCLVMLFGSVPMEALATQLQSTQTQDMQDVEQTEEAVQETAASTEEETASQEETTVTTEEPTEPSEETSASTEESTGTTEETTEPSEGPSESTEETTEPSEEPSESTEETTEPSEEPSESTEETTEPTEPEEEEPHWEYLVNEEGYAVILGYTDPQVQSLSIPYTIDGYYVTAIAEQAFVTNTALEKLYVHGNVQTIAPDALDGLGTILSGYNGTRVQSYAAEYGYDFRLCTDQNYLTFTDRVVDYSYVQGDRYQYLDASTIFMTLPEALPLEVGSLFFLPEAYDDLMKVYQVTAIVNQGDSVILTVTDADYEDALTRISVHDIELRPDWSQAEWGEGVEVLEEKFHASGDISAAADPVSIKFKESLGKKPSSFTIAGKKQNVQASWTVFAEGTLNIKGKATVDANIGWGGKINAMSFVVEPSAKIKGGLKANAGSLPWEKDSDGNIDSSVGVWDVPPESIPHYIARVPLVAPLLSPIKVYVTVYAKVSASGEITISVSGSGRLGLKYDVGTKSFKDINTWTWSPPSIQGQVSIEFGPSIAAEIQCFGVDRVATVEIFAGVKVNSSMNVRMFNGGSADLESGQNQTKKAGFCGDVDIDGKISAGINSEWDLVKDILGTADLKSGYVVQLFNITFDIARWHLDYVPDEGWIEGDKCTYEKTATVNFCTYTTEQLDPVKVKYNATFKEPKLEEVQENKLLGWYTDKNFTKKWDFKNDKVTADMTLHAKWEKTTKTVVFATQDEQVGAATWTDQYVPGTLLTEPAVKIKNWRLKGWFLDEELTDPWDFDKDIMPNDDLTLYASWEYEEGYDPFATPEIGSDPDKNYEINGGKLYFNGHVYQHVADYQLFSAAKADAINRGGYLVTINSQEEMDAVLDYVQRDCAQETLWLGINSTTDWKYWLNGEERVYWNSDEEPTTASNQFNAVFLRGNGQWLTFGNSQTSHYIIEWGDYIVAPGFEDYASAEGEPQYTPSENGESALVVGFGNAEDVAIQNIYNGLLVTQIQANAFRNNTNMKTLSIPNTVETIGEAAFAGCTALEEIELPDSVTTIGKDAFKGCTALKRVVLPSGITVLPEGLFDGCTALETIENTNSLIQIGDKAFYGCTSLRHFVVPNKLKTIGNYAFGGCTSLETLVMNPNITAIGGHAFDGCGDLAGQITIPISCTSVGQDAFRNCTGLTGVYLACQGSAIGTGAFNGVGCCFYGKTSDGIDTWCAENGKKFVDVEGTYLVRFYSGLYKGSSQNPGIEADGMEEDMLLTPGSYLTEPTLTMEGYYLEGWYTDPDFTNRWDFARDTVGYESLTLYANWVEESTIFDYYVQNGKVFLSGYSGTQEKVVIPDTLGGYPVVGIGARAFDTVENMKSLVIPASVTTVEAKAIQGCRNLYNITFPAGNDSLIFSNGMLMSADRKTLIYIPEGRTLAKLLVPEGVERILGGAVANQSSLSRVEIPDTVKEIGDNAFPTTPFLRLYGSAEDCAAMQYAKRHGLTYNEYTVTFYDGEQKMFSAVLNTGSLLTEYDEFESTYATYGGWYRDSGFTIPWNFETDTMPAGNLSLYLKWNSDFAVEGSDSLTITGYVGKREVVVIPERIGTKPVTGIASGAFTSTAEKPIRSITIPDCVTTIADGAISGEPAPVIVANAGSQAEAYATSSGLTYEKLPYTITFEVNGGEALLPMSVVPGEVPQLPVPVKSNSHFLGWYSNAFFAGKWNETDAMPQKDITLYARWEVINNQVDSNLSYTINSDGTAVITEYYGTKTTLVIPATINGHSVTAIGDFAFSNNQVVQTLILPDTVTSLGAYAFADAAVRTITGARNLETLGEGCFIRAKALNAPFIPKGVTRIPEYCFAYCDGFTDVVLSDQITEVAENAFYGCGHLETIELGEQVETVGRDAFAGCPNLTKVTLPTTLSAVRSDTFGSAELCYYAVSTLRLLEVHQLTKSSVRISWNQVAGADGYKLYRKQGTAGSYSLVKTIAETQTTNYSLTPGQTYYYKVVAYRKADGASETIAQSQELGLRMARLSTPTISGVEALSADSASMFWATVAGATGYEVWRAYEPDGDYTLLKTLETTETVNTGLIGGRGYYYRVRAFYDDDGTREYSSFSQSYAFTMPLIFLGVPQNVTLRQTAKGTVLLEWDPVEGAQGYRVYRRKGDGALSLIKTIQIAQAYNYNLTLGQTYGYAVEAYTTTDQETIFGKPSSVVDVTIAELASPAVKSVSQSATGTALVSWTSVSAADGYELWRSRTENGTYSRMKSVTGTATSNYNLTVGVTYYYKVRAYSQSESGQTCYSDFSAPVPVTVLSVAKARIKSVTQPDATSAKITWAYMSGAKQYELWRSVNDDAHFQLLRTTGGTAVQDRNLVDGQTYYYKVRAYDDSGEQVVYGEFSDSMALCILGVPTLAVVEQSGKNQAYITWDKVQDADGYELWRSQDGGSFTKVKSLEVCATNNYNLTPGSTYAYKLRAYRTLGDTTVYSGYSKTISIKVLGIPNLTSLTQNGSDGVKLSWSGDSYADGYELWRSMEDEGGVFTKVKNVTGTSTTSFGLHETKVTYMIRSYANVGGKKVYGPFGKTMQLSILGTPTFTQGEQASTSAVQLSWEAVAGAQSYKLYRSTSPDSGFALVKTVTDTQTATYSLKSGTTYYFKLKAVGKENGVAQESAYSQVLAVYVSDLVAPYIRACTETSNGVEIAATVKGTPEGLELWQAEGTGDFSLVAEGTPEQMIASKVYSGRSYTFKLRAYDTRSGQRVYSAFTDPVSLKTLGTPGFYRGGQRDSGTMYLQWGAVTGAQKYELSRSSDNGQTFTQVGIYSDNYALDTNLASGNYLYRIRAVDYQGSTPHYSRWSATYAATIAEYGGNAYPETAHNYGNNENQVYTYTQPGAQALSLTFNASSYTEASCDYIYVMDGNGQCVARLSGNIGQTTLVTAGDTFQLYFSSDGSGTGYGFSFDSITAATLEEAATPLYSWSISGDTIRMSKAESLSPLASRNVFNHVRTLEIEPGVTSFSDYSFSALNIEKVILPEGLTSIGNSAFSGNKRITEVQLPESLTTIGSYAFTNCTGLTSIDIPDSVTTIGSCAFQGCTALETVTLPASLTTLSEKTFSDCTNLKSVTISEAMTKIGTNAFSNCSNLETVTYTGTALTQLGQYAFSNCPALTQLPVPEGVTTIDRNAFRNCTGLTSITIPASVTKLNSEAFSACTGLRHVTFLGDPTITYDYNSTSGIANGPFSGCTNLESVTFAPGITSISSGLFGNSGIRSVTIPETVTKIGEYAFAGCTRLENVTYAGTAVTKMGGYAFASCTSLERLPVPDSVTEIGSYAFKKCTALDNVTIPAAVAQMNTGTFSGCTGLREVTFLGNPDFSYSCNSTSGAAYGPFTECTNLQTVTLASGITRIGNGLFANSGIRKIFVPEAVTEIGDYAFASCAKLENVFFVGNALRKLGKYAFSGCSRLKTMALPESVTTIDSYSFYKCTGLTQLPVAANVSSIGDHAFYQCTGLKTLDLASVTSIGIYAFYGCTGLQSLDLAQVTTLGTSAFNGCTGLKSVSLGKVTSLGDSSFYGCTGLTSLALPESLTTLGSRVFYGCSGLTELMLPATFENMQFNGSESNGAFAGCTGLTRVNFAPGTTRIPAKAFSGSAVREITLPDTVTEIGANAFSYCKVLRTVNLPEGLLSIGDYAFTNCTILKRFTLPATLTTLGAYAFSNCPDITTVTIPGSVETVSSYLFRNCTSLTTVVMEAGVKTVTGYAFYNCNNLKNITIPSTVTSVGNYAFYGTAAATAGPIGGGYDLEFGWTTAIPENALRNMAKLTSVVVPEGITQLGTRAFDGSGLTAVRLPGTLEEIGNYSFSNCESLTEIEIPEGVTTIRDNAFRYCGNLKDITIPSTVTSVGSYTFYGTGATTAGPIGGGYDLEFGWITAIPDYAFSNMAKLTSVVIPEGLTHLGKYAFQYSGVTQVSLPSTLREMGSSCFYNCNKLTEIVIPAGVTTIDNNTFRYCSSLTSVTLPDTLTSISNYAFHSCSSLADVYYSSTEENWNGISIGNGNDSLTGATIHYSSNPVIASGECGENLTWTLTYDRTMTISGTGAMTDYALDIDEDGYGQISTPWAQYTFSTLVLEEGITHLGDYAFATANISGELKLPSSLVTIGDMALSGNNFTGDIVIPEGVTSIGDGAFQLYTNGALTLPSTLKHIGNYAFYSSRYTGQLKIPAGVTSIGTYAFAYCNGFTGALTLPSGLNSIPDSAFQGCSGLTSVTILNGPASIHNHAFASCSNLASATIPDSVTAIGEGAFQNCKDGLIIRCSSNSAAAAYADNNGLTHQQP